MLTENFAICMRAVQFLLSGPSGPGEVDGTLPTLELGTVLQLDLVEFLRILTGPRQKAAIREIVLRACM